MFDTILLPVDLGDEPTWKRAAPVAVGLARDWDAELHVCSVMPDFGMAIVGGYFDEDYEKKALDELGRRLTEWKSKHAPDARAHVLHGRVHSEIVRAAKKIGADCIVMAAHSPDVTDYLMGPVAAHVMRHAPASVFVVRG